MSTPLSPFERFESFARLTVPYLLLGALFFLNTVALTYPLSGFIHAPFVLMVFYYWAIYRPTLFPVWFVFAAGCLMDTLTAYPLGLHAVLFVALEWLVISQRRFLMGQPFFMVWIGFSAVSFIFMLATWIFFSLINLQFMSLTASLFSFILGIVLFPVISTMLHLTHKVLPDHKHL